VKERIAAAQFSGHPDTKMASSSAAAFMEEWGSEA
jgi:hypothetical protein